MSFNFEKFFPYDEVRKEQEQSIEFTLDAFLNKNKKFMVLEMGTGCGKSGAAMAVARYLNSALQATENNDHGAYFLTTQKILQEQYIKDFGGGINGQLTSIKSSSNYTCKFYKMQSCGESSRMLKTEPKKTNFFNTCTNNCTYKNAKKKFLNSPESITNYAYFLSETVYAGKITPRNLLVLDECHNVPDELQKFVEVSISEYLANLIGINMPEIKTNLQAIKWIKNDYLTALGSQLSILKKLIKNATKSTVKIKETELSKLTRKYEKLDKHSCKIERFLDNYDKDNWVLNISPAKDRISRKLEFKPIDISSYASNLLFRHGKHVIMMSATVLNKKAFCSSLGIKEEDAEFISIDSPFPFENRPIFYAPVGKMSSNEIDRTLPHMSKMVKELLKYHKDEKGIIHTNSYKIAYYIKNKIKSDRILVHNQDDRESVLEKHLKSKKPTVLISPSMTEGVDLYDDLSRFQIICKTPFPYLGDPVVRKRMKKWNWWYPYMTAKTIIQSIGRSIRNKDDHCITYILDQNFEYFHNKNTEIFPPWFKKVLQK